MFTLAKMKKTIHKWLYIENDEIIDVMLGVYVANRFRTDPLWLIFIAPPSSTKTELLRIMLLFPGRGDIMRCTTAWLLKPDSLFVSHLHLFFLIWPEVRLCLPECLCI